MPRVTFTPSAGEPFDLPPWEAAVECLRMLTPTQLGKMKRDVIGAIQRERRGVKVRVKEEPKDGDR